MTPATSLALVGCGGVLGALTRYLISQALAPWSTAFPLATMAINLSGAFALGIIGAQVAHDAERFEALRLCGGVGFLGAYTTFSTYSLETLKLLQAGSWAAAATNLVLSPVLGLLAAWLGYRAGGG